MKIEINLDLLEVDDYWGESVADRIQEVVNDEVTKFVRKEVKAQLKKSEKEIQKYVADLTGIKIKQALKDLNI